jgi:hypothetical protein
LQGNQGNQGTQGNQGNVGPPYSQTADSNTISFSALTTSPYVETKYAVTTALLSRNIIIQGYSNNTIANVQGVVELYPVSDPGHSTTYWTILMTVRGTNVGASATYTIYYYYANS